MASNTGKGKAKKGNKKTMSLVNFLAEETSAPQGFNVVNTRKIDWADSIEDDLDDTFTLNFKRTDTTKVLLPSAPKATRGPDIDLTRVPTDPPFKAYVGNLPYDVTEQEINRYFSKLEVIDVRLPTVDGRQRGFAYAEFGDRQSLIEALAMNGDTFRNRQMKVGLPGDSEKNRDSNREERTDRTTGNWRSNPREDNPPSRDMTRDTPRDTYQSYNSRNGSNDNSYSDRNMQRNRTDDSGSYGRRFDNNDRGFRPSNDRGFDRGFERGSDNRSNNYSNDRGFDRQNDRGFDRPNNRYGNRFNDRTDGYEESRDYGSESNDRSYGSRGFDDSNRSSNRNFNDRRNDRNDSRRDYGFDRRGRDQPRDDYETRDNTSPTPKEEEKPKERPKLQLQPRSKPIEKSDDTAAANSAIFGGAKPVNTAAREQEIEQKLLKEREESDKKRDTSSTDERIRRISSGSNVSGNSRSRKGSDSGRDFEDNYRNGSNRSSRSRKTSERSTESAPKYIMTRNKESSNASSKYVTVRSDETREQRAYGRGNNNPNNRFNNPNNSRDVRGGRRERDGVKSEANPRPPRMSQKSDEEEERKVAYTTANKFAHLPTEDYDEDDTPLGEAHNTSD